MILTGAEIEAKRRQGLIIIEPFEKKFLEPNSYMCHLGSTLLVYTNAVLDAYSATRNVEKITIPQEGYVLHPHIFYLASTIERIGGIDCATELYAPFSISSLGIFIQTSAPVGHMGSAIRWTLEIVVAHSVRVFVGQKIGKMSFWETSGAPCKYGGRYADSVDVMYSLLSGEHK